MSLKSAAQKRAHILEVFFSFFHSIAALNVSPFLHCNRPSSGFGSTWWRQFSPVLSRQIKAVARWGEGKHIRWSGDSEPRELTTWNREKSMVPYLRRQSAESPANSEICFRASDQRQTGCDTPKLLLWMAPNYAFSVSSLCALECREA